MKFNKRYRSVRLDPAEDAKAIAAIRKLGTMRATAAHYRIGPGQLVRWLQGVVGVRDDLAKRILADAKGGKR